MENDKLLANIKNQIKKLLEQLKDLEENKADFEAAEYEEMKTDTVKQLKTFQEKLEQFKGKDGILLTEAQKTQNEIIAAVSKAFDKNQIKQNLTSGMAEGIRKDIKILAKENKPDTVPKILALLQKLIDLETPLTPEEKEFYSSFEGADFEKVKKDKGSFILKQRWLFPS
jgi:leucyl aminopeptidase (aminopeptidase T)